MIRVFITSWHVVDGAVRNPVLDYVDTLPAAASPADRITLAMFYPDANTDGVPDLDAVIVVADGPANIEAIADQPGVDLLPPYPLDYSIANIPQPVIDGVVAMLVGWGVPQPHLGGTATAGELLDRIESYFAAAPVSISDRYSGRWAEFA